ncbi:MAG: hypothetical protein OXG57_11190 [Acidimicrobiaceae bacterium]|nr:hypothetical protein [Acidimicrobiaceae bacterium]
MSRTISDRTAMTAPAETAQLDIEQARSVLADYRQQKRIVAVAPGTAPFAGQWTEQAMVAVAGLYDEYGETVELGTVQAVAAWHACRFGDGDFHKQSQRRCADVLGIDVKGVRRADTFLHLVCLLTITGRPRCIRRVEIGALWPVRPRSAQQSIWGRRGTRRPTQRDQTESPTDSDRERAAAHSQASGDTPYCAECGQPDPYHAKWCKQ